MKMKKLPVAQIVARMMKGMSFNPPPEGYAAYRAHMMNVVGKDLATLPLNDFVEKYRIYLY